jgi:hypothetical protein
MLSDKQDRETSKGLGAESPASVARTAVAPAAASSAALSAASPVLRPSTGHGLSKLSRIAGEDFSELGRIVVHTEETLLGPAPNSVPHSSFIDHTTDAMPFASQRSLYSAIARLTLGWGTFGCQITLERLSGIAGIRNYKTLRKWLSDLHRRNLIRYVPVHGDMRGPIILLTPPDHVRLPIERAWRVNQ